MMLIVVVSHPSKTAKGWGNLKFWLIKKWAYPPGIDVTDEHRPGAVEAPGSLSFENRKGGPTRHYLSADLIPRIMLRNLLASRTSPENPAPHAAENKEQDMTT